MPGSDERPAKKTYHHGNLREALIHSALEILEKEGVAGLSLRACAERTGVSHTAPKNHFGNMTGLLTAVAARGYEQLTDFMQPGSPDTASPEMPSRTQRRDAALKGYVAFALAHPALFGLMTADSRINHADPVLQAPVGACFAVLREAARGLVWDKSDKPDADIRAQMMFWSFVQGFAQLSLSGKFSKDAMKDLTILDVLPDFAYR